MSFPRPGSQHLHSCFRHHHGLLELGGELAVRRHRRPVVGPGLVRPHALGNHGLDGEGVPGLHDADGLVLGVVGHVGGAVEEAVDAVAALRPHHKATMSPTPMCPTIPRNRLYNPNQDTV